MNSYPLHLLPVRTLFYCEFSWRRDATGGLVLHSEPAAFGQEQKPVPAGCVTASEILAAWHGKIPTNVAEL